MKNFDLAQPKDDMDYILSKNCSEDLFIRVMANLEDTNIISNIIFLPEEKALYDNWEYNFIGIDWNIYDTPICYNVEKHKIHQRGIAPVRWEEASNFLTIPFYLIPNEITYFEYWLENYFHFPINMEKLYIQFINLQDSGMALRYQLRNTTIKEQNDNLFVGSFARVSDGWKFYPKFKEHDLDIYDVLRKYNKL